MSATAKSVEAASKLWETWLALPAEERALGIAEALDNIFADGVREGVRLATPGEGLKVTPERAEMLWMFAGRRLGGYLDEMLAAVYGRRVLHTLFVWPVPEKTHTVGNMKTGDLYEALVGVVAKYETRREI